MRAKHARRDSPWPKTLQPLRQRASNRHHQARHWPLLFQQGCPKEIQAKLKSDLLMILQKTLADPKGQWLLSQKKSVTERSLWSEHGIRTLDLIFIDGHAQHWIVDYKFTLESMINDTWQQLQLEKHQSQLYLYQKLYKKCTGTLANLALYYPIQSLWLPLDTNQGLNDRPLQQL
jgi:hypothetical protein